MKNALPEGDSRFFTPDLLNTTTIRKDLRIPVRKWYSSSVTLFLASSLVTILIFLALVIIGYQVLIGQMLETVTENAAAVINHFSNTILPEKVPLTAELFGPVLEKELKDISKDFNLWKVKIYSPKGQALHSTDDEEIGSYNQNSYFLNIVAKGKPYAHLITESGLSGEGEPVPRDMIEVYIPIMDQGQFLGAFEVYYDITMRKARTDRLLIRLILTTGGLASLVLALLLWTSLRERRLNNERIRAEEDLIESERRFRTLIEQAPTGIFIVQDQGMVYRNRQQMRMQTPFFDAFELNDYSRVHPQDINDFEQFCNGLKAGELRSRTLDFRFYPEESSGGQLDLRWAHCRATAIDHLNRPAVLVNMIDLTRAKRLEALVRSQDKMVSLGRVSAGIAHEIRNPLSGINIYLDMLKEQTAGGAPPGSVKGIIQQVYDSSRKIENVINRVMDFARPGEPAFTDTSINKPVQAAMELAGVTLRKSGIQMITDITASLPLVHIDPTQIEQVVLNLINNAADALQDHDGQKTIRILTARKDNHVIVQVEDSGDGIPIEARDQVFEPFFTTKRSSTGIGLSICHRIIADHNGTLRIGTGSLPGASFTIELPLAQKEN